jgi:hypothetical protein
MVFLQESRAIQSSADRYPSTNLNFQTLPVILWTLEWSFWILLMWDSDRHKYYYIELIFYSEQDCKWNFSKIVGEKYVCFISLLGFIAGRQFVENKMTIASYPWSIVTRQGKFQDNIEIIPLKAVREQLDVYIVTKNSEQFFLIRLPSFCSHSWF